MEALVAEIEPTLLASPAEVNRLAMAYLQRKALPAKSVADALHVAHATVHRMDLLVSWNFRHLANVSRRDRIVAINLEEGYGQGLNLVTPLEVLNHEDD